MGAGDQGFRYSIESPQNPRFQKNEAKSRLKPSQYTEYLGLSINSLSYHVRLLEERESTFRHCLVLFQLGKVVTFRLFLRVLELMASVILVVHLGLLMMTDFQQWVASLHLFSAPFTPQSEDNSTVHGGSLVMERTICADIGRTLEASSSSVTVTTDTSRWGWGATLMDEAANSVWSQQMGQFHINMMEMHVVFLALRHFLPHLNGRHVLVKTDNLSGMVSINHQRVHALCSCAVWLGG